MFKKTLVALASPFLLTAAAASSDGAGTALAGECRSVIGQLASRVTTDACTSPLDLCTLGRYWGVQGAFGFTATSLTPAANPDFAQTTVAFYTGDAVIRTKDGDLMIKDAGAFDIGPTSNGDFGAVLAIIGGTGDFVGATGRIRIEGLFVNGCVDCRYRGEVCTQ
jgi:hypothetical protein